MKKEVLVAIIFLLLVPLVAAHGDVDDGHVEDRDTEAVVDDVIAQRLQNASYLAAGLGVILIAGIIVYGLEKKKSWPKMLVNIAFIAVILLVGYSFYYFQLTASETTGITVCENNQCFWAAHTHSEIHINICGENIESGLEKGDLGKLHTHKEKNRLHFHERLPVNPDTKEIANFTNLQLHTFFDSIGMTFNSTCINDKCNGDLCDDTPGTLTMTVNDKPNIQYETYAYSDGDDIHITFN